MEDIEMINLSFLTNNDVEKLTKNIGFTEDEKFILEHLVKDDLNDDGIMLRLHMHRNKYYDTKMRTLYKIIRYAADT